MILKFKVTRKSIIGEFHQIGLHRARNDDSHGWGDPDVTINVKPEDQGKFKMGEILSFSLSHDVRPDYEAPKRESSLLKEECAPPSAKCEAMKTPSPEKEANTLETLQSLVKALEAGAYPSDPRAAERKRIAEYLEALAQSRFKTATLPGIDRGVAEVNYAAAQQLQCSAEVVRRNDDCINTLLAAVIGGA